MQTDTEKRIKELLKLLKENGTDFVGKDGKPLSNIVEELEQEISKLKNNKGITIEEFERRLGGKENFDKNGVYAGSASNQQPKPTPQPNKPDEKPQPNDPWFVTGLSGLILTNAKNNYQPTDIVNGKYQNIQLIRAFF